MDPAFMVDRPTPFVMRSEVACPLCPERIHVDISVAEKRGLADLRLEIANEDDHPHVIDGWATP